MIIVINREGEVKTLSGIIDFLKNLIQPPTSYIMVGVITAICILLCVVIGINIRNVKKVKQEKKESDDLFSAFKPEMRIEESLTNILGIVSRIIGAQSHAFYILDEKSGNFILRSVRNMVNENGKVGPAYSGLLPYKKEVFVLPPTLSADKVKDSSKIIKEGKVSLLVVPIKGGKALMLIGPVNNLPKKMFALMNSMGKKIAPLISSLIKIEELNNHIKSVDSSDRAVKKISNMFSSYKGMIDMILTSSMQTIGAPAGIFIKEENGVVEMVTSVGLDESTNKTLSDDIETQIIFKSLVRGENIVNIKKGDKNFFRIPPYLAALGMEAFILVDVTIPKGKAIAVFSLDDLEHVKDYQKEALILLARRMGDIITNYKKFEEYLNSYIDILKMLAKLVDNLSIYNVGYSDLMYRYALIISKELNLSQKDAKEISLAAYFSNIGVIGLSDDLINKKGKYDQSEYEMMKHHADAGAAIIEATIGNKEMATYIRYHHERIDGNGYPANLKEDEIPIGSKVIAVIQTFLAKIQGRSYRDPLPFDMAIEQIKTASDTQLDSKVTDTLIKWFNKKSSKDMSKAVVGHCHEIRCSPERICISCPAYKSKEKNCWEYNKNNCLQHGNSCDTCFVYGEYKYRTSKKHG